MATLSNARRLLVFQRWPVLIALFFTLLLSIFLCGIYLKFARHWQILDQPNERSSHQLPTPHGGGLPLFVAFSVGMFAAAVAGTDWPIQYLWLLLLAGGLVLVGVIDDVRGLSVPMRFATYGLCCAVAVQLIMGAMDGGIMGLLLATAAVFALLWMLNLYNFMDGIDAYAATQCFIACACAALLAWRQGTDPAYPLFCLLLAAAHAGFLFWNWPPARLFMGDAGSIPTGFLLGSLALLGEVQGAVPLASWLILLAAFIVDSTVTLLWRMGTGQPFTRPHRLHAYQRLSRKLGGHLPVVLLLLALNALWLGPLAFVAALNPKYSILLVILAYVPLVWGMAKVADFR